MAGSASSERGTRVLIGALAGSVVIVIGALLMLRRAASPEPLRSPPARAEPALGVRAGDVDSARREAPARVEAAAPVMVVEPGVTLSPERERWLAAPPPPPPVDLEAAARQVALADARTRVTAMLQDTLDARRSELRRACWKPGGAESAQVFVQARFAADGGLLDLAVADDGDDPTLRACVLAQKLALKIDPPGEELAVRATLALP